MVLLSRITRWVQRDVIAQCNAMGVTATQFAILEVLDSKGELSVGDIERLILSTPGNVPYVINNLCKKGWAKRENSHHDKRVTLVSLTPEGTAKIDAIRPIHDRILTEAFSALSFKEKRELSRMLFTIYRQNERSKR
ncbi:MarR family winged helix-turn-helix transcriptional regulator [uncultured Megasphaera sp.]|uniref:MarR family winged helix-turn-helix transcriptional regulator n=1 Tax=Megasphaera massiliensis TaxID=1232428 RepID=UPI00266C29D1|nr:MarR family transcriptional regulator [uncultured Megasphaera sp.]